MAIIGTFGQFTTARLAIYASQASLSVTGNNIANINTEGYTRQRMDLVSLYSTGQGKYANIFNTNVGYGVLTRGATQLRDPYLDIRYRNESAKLGASEEKLDGLRQIGSILDEVGKGDEGFGVIEGQFNTFFEALEDLNTNLGSEEYDKLVRSAATTLTAYFRKAAEDLENIKVNKVNELNESISDINKLLTNIRDLNVQIRTQGIYGDKALELRDARNLALDKLSEYMHIDVQYSMEQIDQFTEVEKLTVTIAGSEGPDGQPIKLVDGIYGGQITMPQNMPELNPNADNQKILDAMKKARDAAMALSDDAVKERAEKENLWSEELDKALEEKIKAAQDREVQKVLDKYNEKNNQLDLKTEEDVEKIADETLKKNIKDAIEKAKAWGEKLEKDKVLNPLREKFAAADEDKARTESIEKWGKYLKADGKTATNDWEVDENGEITSGKGYFNYNDKDQINPESLYLLRVEKLVDQRGRVMQDKNEPSGKSEIVALDDITFCGKGANTDGTANAGGAANTNSTTALGSLQAIREMLTREGEYCSKEDKERDPNAVIKRGLPYYERALDNLAKKFAEVFNGANQLPATTVYQMKGNNFIDAGGKVLTLADGTEITADMVTKKVADKDGNISRVPLDTKEAAEALKVLRENAAKVPGYGYYDGGVLISNRSDNDDPSNITAANISISESWGNHSVRMLNTTQKSKLNDDGTEVDHTTRNDNITHFIAEFQKKRDFLASDVQDDALAVLPVFHGTFQEVFTAISGVLGDDTEATMGKTENYTVSALNLENERQSVSGVDLNDEATSMMQFSKSYAAACRLLTTIDSMLDTLINGTAR